MELNPVKREANPEESLCGICLDKPTVRGFMDSCQHTFCFDCIYIWAYTKNACPLCQRVFTRLERKRGDGVIEAVNFRGSGSSTVEPEGASRGFGNLVASHLQPLLTFLSVTGQLLSNNAYSPGNDSRPQSTSSLESAASMQNASQPESAIEISDDDEDEDQGQLETRPEESNLSRAGHLFDEDDDVVVIDETPPQLIHRFRGAHLSNAFRRSTSPFPTRELLLDPSQLGPRRHTLGTKVIDLCNDEQMQDAAQDFESNDFEPEKQVSNIENSTMHGQQSQQQTQPPQRLPGINTLFQPRPRSNVLSTAPQNMLPQLGNRRPPFNFNSSSIAPLPAVSSHSPVQQPPPASVDSQRGGLTISSLLTSSSPEMQRQRSGYRDLLNNARPPLARFDEHTWQQ